MGCGFELIIDPANSEIDRLGCQSLCEEVEEMVLDWHRMLSVFDEYSVISRFNNAAPGESVRVSNDLGTLLLECDRIRTQTHGAFDISVGSLMNRLGFRENTRTASRSFSTPDSGLPGDAEKYGYDQARGTLTKIAPQVQLDFGAVAKGMVLDRAGEMLAEQGVHSAFLHGGGSSILAIGRNEDDRPWTARIGTMHGEAIEVENIALGISNQAGRTGSYEGIDIGHIVDPRTSSPCTLENTHWVCVHRSALTADAYSTAVSVDARLAQELASPDCAFVRLDGEGVINERIDPYSIIGNNQQETRITDSITEPAAECL